MQEFYLPVSLDHSTILPGWHFGFPSSPSLYPPIPSPQTLRAGCHQSEVELQRCDGRSDTRALVLLSCTSASAQHTQRLDPFFFWKTQICKGGQEGGGPLYCMCSLVRGNKQSTSTGQARKHSVPHHCALHSMDVPNVLAHEIFHLSGRIIAFAVSWSMTNAALHLLFSAPTNILSSLEGSAQPRNIYFKKKKHHHIPCSI